MDGHEVGQELPGVGDVVEAHASLELGELVVSEVAVTGVEAEPVGEVVAYSFVISLLLSFTDSLSINKFNILI